MAKILLVDDDRVLSEAMKAAFVAIGHQCVHVTTGEQAFQILKNESVDLIILDVMLAGMSGFEICRRIHADASLYAMPILILSAMDGEEEMSHGFSQGADDYVTKPFRMEALLSRVDNLLTSAQTPLIDPMTSMPGHRFIRLELQKAISQGNDFALLYVELMRLGEYARAMGNQARVVIVRQLAQLIDQQGKSLSDGAFRAGHMGGGHFACLVSPEHAQTFGENLVAHWKTQWDAEHASTTARPKSGALPTPALMICLTHRRVSGNKGVGDYFEILSHLREKAIANKLEGLCCDQRI